MIFFQKHRVSLIVTSLALILLGTATGVADGKPFFFIIFTIPGILLGFYLFLTSSKINRPNNNSTDVDELIKWNQLKESGAISDEEYKKKKKEILG